MRARMFAVLFALLAASNAEEFFKYDAAAVKRFDDELRRLGVVLPSLSKPDEPVNLADPTVSSAAGDFEGYWTKSQFGRPIAVFEGIPYAQPPVGPLRFKVAQPSPRLGNFEAKKPGSKCTQSIVPVLATRTDRIVGGREDCLFLNIYVPEKVQRGNTEKLPVMFFVHGGGYINGQGDLYQSNTLLDKDVVLVTFNYRLGLLGFLTTEDDVIPGNLGLKDQVAALRWVHENIAAFGGDPKLVTVFGHSAGGSSSEFLMTSPLTKGLIHRIIAISGSSLAPWAIACPGEMAEKRRRAAELMGCPAEPSEDLLACLQTKSPKEITVVEYDFQAGLTATIPFKPVVEGDIPGAHIPRHPKQLFADGPANDVPYMAGITSQEGLFFTAHLNDSAIRVLDDNFLEYGAMMLLLTAEEKKQFETLRRIYFTPGPLTMANLIELSNMFTDLFFLSPALKAERQHRKGAKAPCYFYYFASEGSGSFLKLLGIDTSHWNYGVSHGDDLFYLFTIPTYSKPSPQDVLMSIILTDLYSSFARDGVPTSPFVKTRWQPVTTKGTDIEFLHLKSPVDIRMQKDLLPERWSLVQKLFDSNKGHGEV